MNAELRDTPSVHQPPPGAGFMNALRWTLFAGLLVLALASLASYVAWRVGEGRAAGAHAALYHCPMHPTYTSDRPGDCPICGMDLVPVPRDSGGAAASDVPGLAGVTLTPERIQRIGVRTAVAAPRALGTALELTGSVVPDESRLARVQLRVAGWVQALHVANTGERVRAGQPLLELYSPELFQSENEYLIERRAREALPAMAHDDEGAAAARQRLALLGVPDEELARLDREGTASTRLTLRAPMGGTVLERGVTEGQYVGADTPLLTLADLSRVWVLADLYPADLARVRAGDPATFATDAIPGRAFASKVEFVYPTAEGASRTVKARLALADRDGELRPGLFGRVTVRTRTRTALAVPSEALVRAGERDYVFLARAGGRFEPRAVAAGADDGTWVEIARGLAAGDTVVASGSFLLDSESRLRAAVEGAGAAPGATAPAAPHAHGSVR